MQAFHQAVADDMKMVCDEHFIMAIEAACVTTMEYARDPLSCHQRIRGALEEMDPSDGLAEPYWD